MSSAIGQVVDIGPVSKFPAGRLTTAVAAGKPVWVSNVAGTITVYSAICTHLGCIVSPSGAELHCLCHASIFSATGAVIKGPARLPLPTYDAQVQNGSVLVGAVNLKRANYPTWYRGQFL